MACLAMAWLFAVLPGCSVDEFVGSSASNPTPDEIATAALAPKPAQTEEVKGTGVHCPGRFGTFREIIKKSSKNPGKGINGTISSTRTTPTRSALARACTARTTSSRCPQRSIGA